MLRHFFHNSLNTIATTCFKCAELQKKKVQGILASSRHKIPNYVQHFDSMRGASGFRLALIYYHCEYGWRKIMHSVINFASNRFTKCFRFYYSNADFFYREVEQKKVYEKQNCNFWMKNSKMLLLIIGILIRIFLEMVIPSPEIIRLNSSNQTEVFNRYGSNFISLRNVFDKNLFAFRSDVLVKVAFWLHSTVIFLIKS